MKQLNDAELNQKIDAFMSRKLAQHPELSQTDMDGVHAGKLWQVEARFKEALGVLDGSHRRQAKQS